MIPGVTTPGPFAVPRAAHRARGPVERLLDRFLQWLTLARTRRALAALDERALHDIGIDRATAMEEAAKPFWRGP